MPSLRSRPLIFSIIVLCLGLSEGLRIQVEPLVDDLSESETISACLEQHFHDDGYGLGACKLGTAVNATLQSGWARRSSADMLSAFQNRKLVFLGDSLTRHQMEHLVCALASAGSAASFEKTPHPELGVSYYMHINVEFPEFNLKIEHRGGGRNWRPPRKRHTFTFNLTEEFDRLYDELGSRDLILLNQGMHDNDEEEIMENYSPGDLLSRTLNGYEDVMGQEMQDVMELASHAAQRVYHASNSQDRPFVFWRETSPQHWSWSRSGLFKTGLPKRRNSRCHSVNEDELSSEERARVRMRNELPRKVLEAANIPIIPVFDVLLPEFDNHCKDTGDCSHLSQKAQEFVNEAFLNTFAAAEAARNAK